jgi:hypothetical protein
VIEILERRLPPGDIWTLFLGGAGLALGMDADKLENSGSALSFDEKPALIREIGRQTPDANAPSEDIVTNEREKRQDDATADPVNQQMAPARTFSRPSTAAVNLTPVAGASFAGLATPSHRNTLSPVTPGRVSLDAPFPGNGPSVSQAPNPSTPSEAAQSEVLDNFGKLPLSFEQNVGQFDDGVDFVSHAGSGTVFLMPTAMVMAIQGENSESRIQNPGSERTFAPLAPLGRGDGGEGKTPTGVGLYMNIIGANPGARATATNQQPGITNYFIGNDPNEWHTNIASFGRVEYDDVYPGIDLAYYGKNQQLEYDFIVSPGADPNQITLNFAGGDGMEVNAQGDLIVHTAAGDVLQQKPFTYQEVGNTRQEVASGYTLEGTTVRFDVGNYDPSRPLVIDPIVMGYSTFLGGSDSDSGNAIAVDAAGNAYVTGTTSSTNFPTSPGAYDISLNGFGDTFLTKLNAAGTGIYSTYLGGSSFDSGAAIALGANGDVFVTGSTSSSNFPTTEFGWDKTANGSNDVFMSVFSLSGTALDYSTYIGGSGSDTASGIALDVNDYAYITGNTESTNYPTTAGVFDTTYNGGTFGDVFVTKLPAIPFGLLTYSTFLGGSVGDTGRGIAVDANGNAYVTGWTDSSNFPTTPGSFDTTYNGSAFTDGFVTKLDAIARDLLYSTYLGGIGSELLLSMAVDSSGDAYVTGHTTSGEYPTTPGAFSTSKMGIYDGVVTKLNPTGSALVYSTFLGGSESETLRAIKVDAAGSAYVSGETNSSNFPTTPGAVDTTYNFGAFDAFVMKLNPAGSALGYSTFLGGTGEDLGIGLATDATGSMYVSGYTESPTFPTTSGAFDTTNGGAGDAFVTKLRVITSPCGCFKTHTITTTALGAHDVYAIDVDGDGDTDILSASYADDKIVWYENNGTQSFTPHTLSSVADVAESVFAADMDNDGDTDVLSASSNDDKIAWYQNNGNEVFSTITITTAADGATSVFAADVDGDGDMDVLSSSTHDDKIAWYKNSGSGLFTTHTIDLAADGARRVHAADVNGDGNMDVLSSSSNDDKISWYKNDGNENFTKSVISAAADVAIRVYAADVDGDGDTDVLSASIGDDKIAWYENNGGANPTFTAHTITTAADGAHGVYAADIDADGDTDVLSASHGDDKIVWYKNSGGSNPTFSPRTVTTAANGARNVYAADADGDGDLDVLSASSSDHKIAWYENRNLTKAPGIAHSIPPPP